MPRLCLGSLQRIVNIKKMFVIDDGLIVAAATGVAAWVLQRLIKSDSEDLVKAMRNYDQISEPSYSLFVFGNINAGKSTFLEKIGAKVTTSGIGTPIEPYPSFIMKLGEKTIKIEKGNDIGGDPRYLSNGTIEKMLVEKDKVIFIFSAKEFLDINNIRYRGEVWSRLETLYKPKAYKSKIIIIASWLRECGGDRYAVANEIRKQLVNKSYRDILNDSFGVYELTNGDDIELIKEMIFK